MRYLIYGPHEYRCGHQGEGCIWLSALPENLWRKIHLIQDLTLYYKAYNRLTILAWLQLKKEF